MTVEFKTSKVFDRLLKNIQNRYQIFYGGSSSSKTISILQYLTLYAYKYPNKRITISAESTPVIRKTLFADWCDVVMKELYDPSAFNGSEMVYKFPSGSIFQFIPADDASRFHGLRQDIIFFDEIYNIKKAIYDQADIRTKEKVFCSFNPTSQFWLQDHFLDKDTYVDHSTYLDNPFLTQIQIDAINKRKLLDPNFHNVYALGLFGDLEGIIFRENVNWFITNEFPDEFSKKIYGMDFGFSVDPTSLVDVRYSNGELYIKELLYDLELTNPDISKHIDFKTICDSSEPKSIAELKRLGCDISGAVKGPDSIINGIKKMKEFKINITKDSLNLIQELRKYKWAVNKQGERLNRPIDDYNHAIDAIRYALFELFNQRQRQKTTIF